jgi:hypothetical protein
MNHGASPRISLVARLEPQYKRGMSRLWWIVLVAVACKDDSGTARKVSPAPSQARKNANAPEPPGGPPSCADVAVHLAAALEMPTQVGAETQAGTVSVSGDSMSAGIVDGIAAACREGAWTLDARKCALGWQGNILRERAQLRDACPGTVK